MMLKRIFCWLLLLQMANLSVDPARHFNIINGTPTLKEDLSINTIESIGELVLECVFQIDVPETQDSDDEGLQKTLDKYLMAGIDGLEPGQPQLVARHNYHYFTYNPEHFPALDSPPPKG